MNLVSHLLHFNVLTMFGWENFIESIKNSPICFPANILRYTAILSEISIKWVTALIR